MSQDKLQDFLSSPERVKAILEAIKQQCGILENQKAQKQNEINTIQDRLNQFSEQIPVLEGYLEFLDLVGYSKINQTVQEHAEEMKHAREERLKQKHDEDTVSDFSINEKGSFSNNDNLKDVRFTFT